MFLLDSWNEPAVITVLPAGLKSPPPPPPRLARFVPLRRIGYVLPEVSTAAQAGHEHQRRDTAGEPAGDARPPLRPNDSKIRPSPGAEHYSARGKPARIKQNWIAAAIKVPKAAADICKVDLNDDVSRIAKSQRLISGGKGSRATSTRGTSSPGARMHKFERCYGRPRAPGPRSNTGTPTKSATRTPQLC